MLSFKLSDWIILKNIFININEIIDELVIMCDFNGLKFNAIDRSHVCFFKCVINKELFDSYEITELLELHIDLNELVKVLKRGSNKDDLNFYADVERFDIIFKNKNNRKFQITQLDMDNDSKNLPDMEYSVSFNCDFNSIKNTLKDADLYSDRLTFTVDDDLLIMTCESAFGKYENKYPLDESVGSCSSTYGIEWLTKIFNIKLDSNEFKINYGDEYPMLIEMNSEYVNMSYLLAPRIGEE